MTNCAKDSRHRAPDWMDKSFFQTALRSGYQDTSLQVISVNSESGATVGDNFCSNIYRVTVEVQRENAQYEKRSLIVKCQPRGGIIEELVFGADYFNTEIQMYTRILPEMQHILSKVSFGDERMFCTKYIYHGTEPLQYIILEDLSFLEYTPVEGLQGLDYSHCVLVLKSLARFHAASIALLSNKPKLVESFYGNPYQAGRSGLEAVIKSSLRSFALEIKTWPGYETYSERLLKLLGNCFDILVKLNNFKEGGFNVLTHGDLWINNMMFKYHEGAVVDVKFIDLQFSHVTSPAIDLHYFMHTSLSDEVHEYYFYDLLNTYHTTLIETLNLLDCRDKRITFQQLEKELDDHGFYAVYSGIHVHPLALRDSDNLDKDFRDADGRAKSVDKLHTSPHFVKTVKRLLVKFGERGWL
ncbi:uncharacterized protein [Anabrus simplex]|uniref:uncharacterized protein n=1 Tax=Anabrus simplex TaxID=316456 RepID=UPI0034DDAC25